MLTIARHLLRDLKKKFCFEIDAFNTLKFKKVIFLA